MTTDTQVRDVNLMLNGLRFHYRDWANDGARPLVALHGFTGHARTWDTMARALRDRYRVLALDQRGHGESEWVRDYAPERRVEDMEAFQAALGLDQFVLLGLSMGGRVAFSYAAKHAERLHKLVIVDIGPVTEAAGSQRIAAGVRVRDVFDDPEEAVAQMRAANARAPEDELRHRGLNNLMKRDDGKWTWRYDVALRSGHRPLVPPPSPAELEAVWASFGKITCPTLLVRGAESDILSRATAERMASTIPDCRLVEVQESGHSVPLDNPKGFLAALDTFL